MHLQSLLLSCFIGAATSSPFSHESFLDRRNETSANCVGVNAISPDCASNEAGHYRDFFYVGGRYVNTSSGHLMYDQMYVEKLTPIAGVTKANPVVFFHGMEFPESSSTTVTNQVTSNCRNCMFTEEYPFLIEKYVLIRFAKTWLNTPDNRKGFASYFIDQGYQVYVIEQTSVGRGAENDFTNFPLIAGGAAENSEKGYTAPERLNAYPQSQNHTQWPGVRFNFHLFFVPHFLACLVLLLSFFTLMNFQVPLPSPQSNPDISTLTSPPPP